jgi:hypothetical protein
MWLRQQFYNIQIFLNRPAPHNPFCQRSPIPTPRPQIPPNLFHPAKNRGFAGVVDTGVEEVVEEILD